MPHADEALKSLISRFREAPSSPAFTDLAAALLVRGHASEALRVAEHGLQLMPASVDGRIERAAALLALGRPRVAFIELKRALAINPSNRRAMRLLGKVYIEAGAPGRAAELLAQRSALGEPNAIDTSNQEEATHVTQAPFPLGEGVSEETPGALTMRADTVPLPRRAPPAPHDRSVVPSAAGPAERTSAPHPTPEYAASTTIPERVVFGPGERGLALDRGVTAPSSSAPQGGVGGGPKSPGPSPAIPDLFSALTKDLGLGEAVPESPKARVEVTQVIRRRMERRARSPSELATIEGPIVDTTQPGQLETTGDLQAPPTRPEPPGLFDAVTSPRLQLASFGLDDEPLFQEHMPFAVRPVEVPSDASGPTDLGETIDELLPGELDPLAVKATIDATPPVPRAQIEEIGSTPAQEQSAIPRVSENAQPARSRIPPLATPAPLDLEPEPAARFDGGGRVLEVSRQNRRSMGPPKLEIITPEPPVLHGVLAVLGAIAMIALLTLLFVSTPKTWTAGLFESTTESVGNEVQEEASSTGVTSSGTHVTPKSPE